MTLVVLAPLIAAVAAGVLAWQNATRLDRESLRSGWPGEPADGGRWLLVLGALVAAVVATTVLQLVVLSQLPSSHG
jgi:hypothetical protein